MESSPLMNLSSNSLNLAKPAGASVELNSIMTPCGMNAGSSALVLMTRMFLYGGNEVFCGNELVSQLLCTWLGPAELNPFISPTCAVVVEEGVETCPPK